jgi:GcrA cell cycle regulator
MWNDERVEELKRYWAEGLSASHIAARLGAGTRNAIIGKVHRLGLSGRTTQTAPTKRQRAAMVRKDKPNSVKPKPNSVSAKPEPVPYVAPLLKADDVARVASVLDLEAHHCRWPVSHAGGVGFCGCQKAEGKSYCAGHVSRATDRRPPAPRPYYTHPSAKIFA